MSFFTSSYVQPLSNEQIMHKAPAVFADRPASTTSFGKGGSNSYLFLPTIDAVEGMRRNGWEVVAASQQMNSKSDVEARMTNKHALFFARADVIGRGFNQGDVLPLIKLENSHNGLSSFALSTGFFRKACANGLTVPESIYATPKVKHTMNLSSEVVEATYRVLQDFPMLMDMQKSLTSLQLNQTEKLLLADACADIFFDKDERKLLQNIAKYERNEKHLLESQLLRVNRWDDKKDDLWTVTNVIQENLIRGNVQTAHASINRYNGGTDYNLKSKRKVTSIDRDREIHEKLFKITQYFAAQKGLKIGVAA